MPPPDEPVRAVGDEPRSVLGAEVEATGGIPDAGSSEPVDKGTNWIFWLSVGWMTLLTAAAVLAPVLPLADPEELGIRTLSRERFESPGTNAWLGADSQGRDMLSLIIWGARPSLMLGLVVTVCASIIGGTLGIVAGFLRGRVDGFIMAVSDIALAFPALILLASLVGTIGRDLWVLILGFTVLGIPSYTRIVRGTTLTVADREFVEAARAMGAGRRRIVWREIVPNVTLAVVSFAFLGFAIVIAAEGGLAFIGLSLDQVTWGVLIADGAAVIDEAAHVALVPATAMFLTILSLNLIADRFRPDAALQVAAVDLVVPTDGDVGPEGEGDLDDRPLLAIENLQTDLITAEGSVRAVDGVSLEIGAGETLGVVGESGSGKTMLLRSILGTFPLVRTERSGRIELEGLDLLSAADEDRRNALGNDIGVVSQNPLSALNPVRTVGSQMVEPMRVHRGLGRSQARRRAVELLAAVGLPEAEVRMGQYPHELSGGMRQRVTIALALANEPKLILADEPTTALDVTIQDQILRLLAELQSETGVALVLVTHDLAVVRGWADRVAVFYAGQIVETGPAEAVFSSPRMRYTEGLLESTPNLDEDVEELATIDGQPPSLIDPPRGCRFAARCPWAQARCREEAPPLEAVDGDDDHRFACWYPVGHPDARRATNQETPA